jgi:uracil DNA glycosylase
MRCTAWDWETLLRQEFTKPYWDDLQAFVAAERKRVQVYPPDDMAEATKTGMDLTSG